jgi:predicted Ser/Thr protein kinase
MDTKRICPGCQKLMPPDVQTELCPACLISAGLNTGTQPGGAKTGFTPPTMAEVAQLFPSLEILSFLGKGGMGAVYKARQPTLDRLVALKVLPPEIAKAPGFTERFNREARALAKLAHPNIVAVHEFGKAGELHYLIMEYVGGANLREVERAGRLTPEQALVIVPQICEALQFAHNQGIVHRDIKPENILLAVDGRVKITDFGIAKIIGVTPEKGGLTGEKDVIGTPHYMAPEQIERPGSVDHRADIFSLGVVFYEMLTGELPLGKFMAPSKKVLVDVRLDEVVMHALEKEPERRYQHASQVKTEVQNIADTPPPLGRTRGSSASAPGPSSIALTAPAMGLMVAGLWKLLSGVAMSLMMFGGLNAWLKDLLGPFGLGGIASASMFSAVLFHLVPAALMIYGGYQMMHRRSYNWSVAAAIVSIVACSLLGFPIGIWALIMLAREQGKAEFGASTVPLAYRPMPSRSGAGVWKFFWVFFTCAVIGVLVICVLAVLACLTVPSLAKARQPSEAELQESGIQSIHGEFQKTFSNSVPLTADGEFALEGVNGRVEIHGWTNDAAQVEATIHGKRFDSVKLADVRVDSSPDHAKVDSGKPVSRSHNPWSWLKSWNDNDATIDYLIYLPQNAQLQGIHSVNGPVTIDGVSGDISTTTVNGETSIQAAGGNLKLATVNGRITAKLRSWDAERSVLADAVNGELEIYLPTNASAQVSIKTVNGGISTDFSGLEAKNGLGVGHSLKGALGSGSGTIKVTTVNGGVRLLKYSADRVE